MHSPDSSTNFEASSSLDLKAGQYWLADANGLDSWPVIICDEDMIHMFFKYHWRPPSARQADGRWLAGFEDGGTSVMERTFPALFLAHMRVFWVSGEMLKPVDLELVARRRQLCNDEILSWVYTKLLQPQDSSDLKYWKDVLLERRIQEAERYGIENHYNDAPRKCKTNSGSEFRNQRGRQLEVGREGRKVRFEKSKTEILDEFKSKADIDSLYETASPPPRRSHFEDMQNKTEQLSVKNSSKLHRPENPLDPIPVYVENQLRVFNIPRASLRLSHILQRYLVEEDETGESCIKGPLLSRIPSVAFRPVSHFLNSSIHCPNFASYLPNISTPEDEASEMAHCATIYCTAHILQITPMQQVAWHKLKMLERTCPAANFLDAIILIFGDEAPNATIDAYVATLAPAPAPAPTADDVADAVADAVQVEEKKKLERTVLNWAAARLAAKFLDLLSAETERLERLLRANKKFAREMFRVLATKADDGEVHADKEKEGSGW